MEEIVFSVDLGGSSLRFAVFDLKGQCLDLKQVPSHLLQDPLDLVRHLQDLAYLFLKKFSKNQLLAFNLGVPGLVDLEGQVLASPHFPQWQNFPLRQQLEKALAIPFELDNDANQAALGEAFFGLAKEWKDFVLIQIGTGLGAGIVLDQKIYRGPQGLAGEVGHMTIEKSGAPGALGIRGTLESLCSLSGLRDQIHEMLRANPRLGWEAWVDSPQLPEILAQRAREGCEISQNLWKNLGSSLACGIANLVHSLGLFYFAIGGGLSGAWDCFEAPLQEELQERLYPCLSPKVQVEKSALGDQAGLLGGLAKALASSQP
ncbi:MAG: ROK family protein [Deltaproteobacteria bacterium]|nr:ROK family protein [Deltaproteobacteria bacterium]